jgi:predicted transcriptional regulator
MARNIKVSARISRRLDATLEKIATLTGRRKELLINDALSGYAKYQAEFVKAVRQGMRDYREGRVVAHEDVIAEFERRKQQRRRTQRAA